MKIAQHHDSKPEWSGYTFDRLAYERAVTLARIELEKHRLMIDFERTRQGNFILRRSTFSRLLNLVNVTDMVVVGVKIWRSIAPLFSKKRKD